MNNETFELFFAMLSVATLIGTLVILAARTVFRSSSVGAAVVDGFRPFSRPLSAAIATTCMLGSLYFSEVVNYRPCMLCWYQRIAMYSLAIVLVIAAVRRDRGIAPYAMVLAGIGALVAGYHWLLERWPAIDTGSCSADAPCSVPYFEVFGFVSLAFMAFCAFVTVIVFLVALPSGNSAASLKSSDTKPIA